MSWSLGARKLEVALDTRRVFAELFADSDYAFWLDSSLIETGLSRFSFLGDARGPHGEVLSYRVGIGVVEARCVDGRRSPWRTTTLAGSIFEVLSTRLSERAIDDAIDLPFDFNCGYVGYFGYELKGDCGSRGTHVSSCPDAVLIAATRMVVVDHLTKHTWLLAFHGGESDDRREAQHWLADTQSRLESFAEDSHVMTAIPGEPVAAPDDSIDPEPFLVRSRDTYLSDIERCQERLRAGDSYQICLTNTAELPFEGDPLALYMRLRGANPAPYAAYLRLGGIHVLCSSPERFLRIDSAATVESRPIKGTAARHSDPIADRARCERLQADPKSRAENVTIVDLVRNDLGRVCEIGSVCVSSLMAVESYATVHHVVSAVRGKLRRDLGAVDAVRACFPGGSMTGAPKLRTMEIIDSLETRARGVYSGALGYFGLGGGADLNIVIRTMVIDAGKATVGAGGAITLDSDPREEYEEMLLKARAPLRALHRAAREALPSPGRI